MDPLTHIAAGVALSQVVPAPSRLGAVAAGVVCAVLPDLDYILALHDRLAYLRHHRGLSHSLVALPVLALLVALAGRGLGGPRWFKPLFIIGILVLGSHLLLDLATSYGTQLLSPFTRTKFTLDWLFIIDPYLTGLLLAAAAALWWAGRGRTVGLACLGLAGLYLLLCGFFHDRALHLARQVYKNLAPGARVAAIPQPFSPRRWHLLAGGPDEVFQAFVTLPLWPFGDPPARPEVIPVPAKTGGELQVPSSAYQPPSQLTIFHWRAAFRPPTLLAPEALDLLEFYQEFSRFPLPLANHRHADASVDLTWADLRFSLPGRSFPFVLQMRLAPSGELTAWSLGLGLLKPPQPDSGT